MFIDYVIIISSSSCTGWLCLLCRKYIYGQKYNTRVYSLSYVRTYVIILILRAFVIIIVIGKVIASLGEVVLSSFFGRPHGLLTLASST